MRIGLLVLAVALVLGGLVGALVVRDPGYVLVAYDQMAVETSLWFALLLLVLAYFLVRLLILVFVRIAQGRVSLGDWNQRRRLRSARQQTVRGLLLMAEGEWLDARRLLEAAAPRVQAPLINYLSAARAANQLGDAPGRDALLLKARESTPGARLAVGLTQAELQRDAGQWQQCLTTLLELNGLTSKQPQVLRMLASCYEQLEDWDALLALGPQLRKHKVLQADALESLLRRAWQGALRGAGAELQARWKSVPRELKRDADLAATYAELLEAAGAGGAAEGVLREALGRQWDERLVRRYGMLSGADARQQIAAAESWLKERPNDAELLLALGRLCLRSALWARAREYFEASLRLRRSAEVQGELGRLCVALGDSERGAEYLVQAAGTLPELPLPTRADAAAG
ncbi:MAG: heme biosynthesis HemY N-terminal domain-containing protein [Pseudomonadales bacterium]